MAAVAEMVTPHPASGHHPTATSRRATHWAHRLVRWSPWGIRPWWIGQVSAVTQCLPTS